MARMSVVHRPVVAVGVLVSLLLVALPVMTGQATVDADAGALAPCAAAQGAHAEPFECPAAIRPGAASNSCTLNFVVTDGTDLFIGAAGHCAHLGKRLTVAGVPGEVGTAVVVRNRGLGGDWAFFHIDPEAHAYVDPTMCGFGGPTPGPLGVHREPVPGEAVVHYGHGASLGQHGPTKGRPGAAVVPFPVIDGKMFAFVGSVDGGDSGSPVRAASGEALGIATATILPGAAPNLVFASRFTSAVSDLEAYLGRPVTTVAGDALPEWIEDALPAAPYA